jgi:hypothetical protein
LKPLGVAEYFEQIAPLWDYWHGKNSYYHDCIRNLIRGIVPPGSTVLELGAGVGDLLNDLRPDSGVGLNVASGLTERALKKFPHLKFKTVRIDCQDLREAFCPDYVLMTNMLDYVFDIWDLLENLRPLMTERTLLVITTSNPLWSPLFRLASKIGLRVPDSPRNFITNRDICSVLRLQGFDIVEEVLLVPVPKRIPLLSSFLNKLLPELPIVRFTSSVQCVVARPRITRPPLMCSVIIPCHNEAENISECIRRVPEMGIRTEIVVVDDGSTDATCERVREVMARDPRVRLLSLAQNQGKAKAVRVGFDSAAGDVLMILDADMAVAPDELPKFLKPLQDGTADFVNGTRLVYPMEGKAMKISNFFGNKGFCYLASWVIRQRVSDTLCGTKALFKRDYLRMPLGGRERWGDFDLLFGAARLKLRILEIPVHYQERRAGKSKMRVMVDGWLFLYACLQGWRMLRIPETVPWTRREPTSLHELVTKTRSASTQ